jgi:hypothetical protein
VRLAPWTFLIDSLIGVVPSAPGATGLVTFDNCYRFARGGKSRRQGRACLARPYDDGVKVLHAASAPSMWSLASLAASSGVLPS